jgi:hypothetical protein
MVRRNDLLVGPKEKAIEAVKAGNKEEAIKYIQELYEEFRPLHDRYGDWAQSLLSFIAKKLGEEAVEEALRQIVLDVYKDRWGKMKNMSHEEIVKMWCQLWKSHYSDFYVEEDEEKTVFVVSYCNSGGRIQKEGKARGRRTSKPYPWSFNQAGVSYYCCHEGVFNQMFKELGLDFIKFEYCNQFDDEGKPTGCPCKVIIYKKKT